MTFYEAWSQWFAGQQVITDMLYGRPIWWWARWGKVIQFLSAMVILVEIIGPDRLLAYSRAIHKISEKLRVRAHSVGNLFLKYPKSSSIILTIGVLGSALSGDGVEYVIVGMLPLFLLLATAFWFVLAAIILVTGTYVFRILSLSLGMSRVDLIAKIASVILLAFGFSLDLLGS